MRLEIALLLNTGFTPKRVSELLNVKLSSVYYYQKQLEKTRDRLNKL
jgi:hypothetical protein